MTIVAIPVSVKNTPFAQAFALQHSSGNCYPAQVVQVSSSPEECFLTDTGGNSNALTRRLGARRARQAHDRRRASALLLPLLLLVLLLLLLNAPLPLPLLLLRITIALKTPNQGLDSS